MSMKFAVLTHRQGERPTEDPSYYSSWGSARLDAAARIQMLRERGYTESGMLTNIDSSFFIRMETRDDIQNIQIMPTRLVHAWYTEPEVLSREAAQEDLSAVYDWEAEGDFDFNG